MNVNRIVGAYLVGTLVSDIIAYKSTSAGFKRGKVRNESYTVVAFGLPRGGAAIAMNSRFELIASGCTDSDLNVHDGKGRDCCCVEKTFVVVASF